MDENKEVPYPTQWSVWRLQNEGHFSRWMVVRVDRVPGMVQLIQVRHEQDRVASFISMSIDELQRVGSAEADERK